jgi:hypothetical protein
MVEFPALFASDLAKRLPKRLGRAFQAKWLIRPFQNPHIPLFRVASFLKRLKTAGLLFSFQRPKRSGPAILLRPAVPSSFFFALGTEARLGVGASYTALSIFPVKTFFGVTENFLRLVQRAAAKPPPRWGFVLCRSRACLSSLFFGAPNSKSNAEDRVGDA